MTTIPFAVKHYGPASAADRNGKVERRKRDPAHNVTQRTE
jgi:hypothetical protein